MAKTNTASGEETMIANLEKNTGKSLAEWIEIVQAKQFSKHGEILKFLKTEHQFTHGFANMVALKARKADAGSATNTDDLITAQYKDKELLKEIYDVLIQAVSGFGDDVEIAPKKAYVSLRRKKQFAMLQPATKSRFEISLNLKEQAEQGMLEAITKANAMCSHVIKIASKGEVNEEVISWLRVAYEKAG
ncbi:MAG: phosphoribosylformylglycinamidine synthase [Thalassobius sp.]|nr:phosphoribosylformylglycinamidine synthase [Thalassovita sp.]